MDLSPDEEDEVSVLMLAHDGMVTVRTVADALDWTDEKAAEVIGRCETYGWLRTDD